MVGVPEQPLADHHRVPGDLGGCGRGREVLALAKAGVRTAPRRRIEAQTMSLTRNRKPVEVDVVKYDRPYSTVRVTRYIEYDDGYLAWIHPDEHWLVPPKRRLAFPWNWRKAKL